MADSDFQLKVNPLKCSEDYTLWRQDIILVLKSKSVFRWAEGKAPLPVPKDSKDGDKQTIESIEDYENRLDQWTSKDSVAQSVILSTLAPSIEQLLTTCDTAKEIWDLLEKQYQPQGFSLALRPKHQVEVLVEVETEQTKDPVEIKTQRRKDPIEVKTEQTKNGKQSIVAVAKAFAEIYGTDENKLVAWQMLCAEVGVPQGRSITQCKKSMSGVFVNLVDFMRAVIERKPVHKYPSRRALSDQIRNTKPRFPLSVAKTNPLLKQLLIQVF